MNDGDKRCLRPRAEAWKWRWLVDVGRFGLVWLSVRWLGCGADRSGKRERSRYMFGWVRLWSHTEITAGAKAQVWTISPPSGQHNLSPQGPAGVGQTMPKHTAPELALRRNITAPLRRHETNQASKNSTRLLFLSFALSPEQADLI